MLQADYHLHSSFSSDSQASMESMIHEAIRRGMKTICFTEHHDIGYPENPDHLDFLLDLPSYKECFLQMKETYKQQIELCFGIELGLMPQTLNECREFAHRENFDFIIGSTHIIDAMDPYEPCYFETYPLKQGLQKYFEHILTNVSSFYDYCVYGHLDYAARYIKDKNFQFSYKDYGDLLDEILQTIIENGKGIEVNTAGLKYGMSDPNPHHEILQRYLELGGEILTIGSDGHCPQHMAYDFQKIPEYLKHLGFQYYTIFREQKTYFEKL